ncbi:MAG: hypothetical protein ABSG21_05555 [Spirochaetia bacterium]
MKKLLGIIVLAAAVAAWAAAQEGPAKVLRAVYIPAAQSDAALDKEAEALIRGTPEMLATSIASLQPFSRADSADSARSVVTIAAAPAGAGRMTVRVRLLEAGSLKSEAEKELSSRALDLVSFKAFLSDTAARFAPLLGLVNPEEDILKVTTQHELIKAVKETDYLDQLDKRLELTLWTTGLLRILDNTAMSSSNSSNFTLGLDILPLMVEADWFFSRDLGLQFSFFFNDSNVYDFGQNSRYAAYGVFLFPGVGFVYRTLGTVSAELSITLSAGWIYLTAKSGDVVDQNSNIVLAQGSSTWSGLIPKLRISPALVWSITPEVALKGALGFDIYFQTFPWYTSPLGDMQFLSIGFAYRL